MSAKYTLGAQPGRVDQTYVCDVCVSADGQWRAATDHLVVIEGFGPRVDPEASPAPGPVRVDVCSDICALAFYASFEPAMTVVATE